MENDITAKQKLLQLIGEMYATDPATEFDSARCLAAVESFEHEARVLAKLSGLEEAAKTCHAHKNFWSTKANFSKDKRSAADRVEAAIRERMKK